MVVRQISPLSLGFDSHGRPSALTVAVGVSITAHVAIALYVALLKFAGPPAVEYPPERVLVAPWVEDLPKPPPPTTTKPPPESPKFHESPVFTDPPIPPTFADPTPKPDVAPSGPPTTFNPPPQTSVEPAIRRDPIIRDPRWVRRPDAGDFARFYPQRALRMGVEGSAEITCGVTANGQVRDCRITGEAPRNFGFGEAALKLSRYLQIAPKTIDGQPVDGGTLIVPIQFRLN